MKPFHKSVGFWLGGLVTAFLIWAWVDSMSTFTNLIYWRSDVGIRSSLGAVRFTVSDTSASLLPVWPPMGLSFQVCRGKDLEIQYLDEHLEFYAVQEPVWWLDEARVHPVQPEYLLQGEGSLLELGSGGIANHSPFPHPSLLLRNKNGVGEIHSFLYLPYWLLLANWFCLWLGGLSLFRRWQRRRLAIIGS